MWAIFKIFIEFVTTSLLMFFFSQGVQGTWHLSSLTRDQMCTERRSLTCWTPVKSPECLYQREDSGSWLGLGFRNYYFSQSLFKKF